MKGKYFVLLIIFSVSVQTAFATNYYWVGNGGNWKDSTHWSLTSGGVISGVIPTIDDNVFFDSNSFTLPGQIVIIPDDGSEIGGNFSTMDWRGVTNLPTFRIRSVTSRWIANSVGGSIYFDDNMILDFYAAEFYMASNSNYQLDTRGHYMGENCWLAFNLNTGLPGYAGANVTCTLLSPINHAWIYVRQGLLNANGNTIIPQTDGQVYNDVWIVGNPNPASLDISGTSIEVGNITIQNSSTIIDNNATITVKRVIQAAGQNFNRIITSDSISVTGSNTFETLELLPGSHLVTSGTQAVNNFIANGTAALPIGLTGGTLTKASGIVDASEMRITNNTATGGAVFNAYASTKAGTVTGWNFLSVTPSDSLALVAIYNATNGPGWTTKTNWLTGPANTWFGVTVVGNRVTELNLSSNQLSGTLPVAMANLSSLVTLNISGNQLTDLPNLSALLLLTSLDLRNNVFTFEDLEPNIGITGITYSPQKIFGDIQSLTLSPGSSLNLSFVVGGSANIYQWKRGGTSVGINSNNYMVPATSISDAGTYSLQVTSALVPGLTISSANQTVNIKLEGLFEWADGGELTQEGIDGTGQGTDQNYGGQWGDFNNDGYEDIFVTGFISKERSYLYKNNGDGTFSKLPNSNYYFTSGRSITWGDYNNDGFLDCFAPAYAAPDSVAFPSIYKNNGNETFTRIPLSGTSAAAGVWADTDNDGDLDLIYSDGLVGFLNLYRNDGNDIFTLVPNKFLSSTTWNPVVVDVNNDDIPDVFVPQGATQNSSITRALYIGTGANDFTLNSSSPLVADAIAQDRGVSWADIDNDGDMDAYIMAGSVDNAFYINDGTGQFTRQTTLAILGETIFGGRGSAFADYDNDGYLDLLTVSNLPALGWYLFRNNGNGTFTKVTNQNFRTTSVFVGASFGDYDNDGFVDIMSASFGTDYNGLYLNKGNSNNWIQLKLVGNLSNKSAIGAKVDVYSSGLRKHQQIIANNGSHNQNSLVAQFGLGVNTSIDSVLVSWPSGLKQKLTNLAVNRKWSIKENNFEIDSLALVALYNATGGQSWTNKTNWLTGNITTWAGVTFTGGSVTAINLPNNNLVGKVPEQFANLIKLQTINLANNKITAIPDLTSIQNLTTVNVSGNALDFSTLEKNSSITGLNYGNQAGLGVASDSLVAVGTDYPLSTDGGGISDQYQWKLNDVAVSGATSKVYTIQSINRTNMGDYTCEITNPTLPGLFLTTANQQVLATATLQGRLLVDENIPATVGDMILYKVKTGAFDTTAIQSVNPDGTYLIEKVILDDYQLLGYADTLAHKDALPTYYVKTVYWEEADTLFLEDNLNDLDIVSVFKPSPPNAGIGEILGFFSEEANTGGRTKKNGRVKNSGASLRRVEKTNRPKDIELTLVAYTFTNEDGEFVFSKLVPGVYRLNLQYPGFPMDTTSFIDITIGTGLFDKQVAVEAQVLNNKIVVTKRIITGWEESDSPYAVYPNPVNDVIRIHNKSGATQRLSIELFNNNGQVIAAPLWYENGNDEWVLNVSKLTVGYYLVKVKDGNNISTLRVVITD